jgi:CheY-like chemotaxis protein
MNRHSPYALVVDDDLIIRMDAAEIFKEAGFRCHEAADAEKAVDTLGRFGNDIRLLFTDVSMPPSDMTGFELARKCAADWPHIRILVASGGVMPEAGDMPAGAVFISKPFTADVIYEHLRSILPEGHRPAPLEQGAD